MKGLAIIFNCKLYLALERMAFAVVKFLNNDGEEETYSEVPTSWLIGDNKFYRWPKVKNRFI